jgi:hypothetical protein
MFGGYGVSFLIPWLHTMIVELYYDNFGDSFRFGDVSILYAFVGLSYLSGLYIYAIKYYYCNLDARKENILVNSICVGIATRSGMYWSSLG